MAITFEKKPLEWAEVGIEPTSELKAQGFKAGYKPPAEHFNYKFHNDYEVMTELQDKIKNSLHTTVLYEGGIVTVNDSSETHAVLSQPISDFDFICIETHESENGNNKFQKLLIASEITRLLSSFSYVPIHIAWYGTNTRDHKTLAFYDESNVRVVSTYTGAVNYRIIGINLFT